MCGGGVYVYVYAMAGGRAGDGICMEYALRAGRDKCTPSANAAAAAGTPPHSSVRRQIAPGGGARVHELNKENRRRDDDDRATGRGSRKENKLVFWFYKNRSKYIYI